MSYLISLCKGRLHNADNGHRNRNSSCFNILQEEKGEMDGIVEQVVQLRHQIVHQYNTYCDAAVDYAVFAWDKEAPELKEAERTMEQSRLKLDASLIAYQALMSMMGVTE